MRPDRPTPRSTHVYVGRTTIYGLRQNSKCRLLGKGGRAPGCVLIATEDEARWIVHKRDLVTRP